MKKRNRFPSIKISLLITLLLFIILFTTMPGFSPKLMSFAVKADSIILIDVTQIEDVEIPETKDVELPKKIVESNDGEESDITDFRSDFDIELVIDDGNREIYRIYDNPPVLLTEIAPEYPVAARQLGIEGMVILELIVEKDGTVSSVTVMKSVHTLLDNAAISAAYNIVFSPAMSRDLPIRSYVTLPVKFVLQ